MNRRAYDDNTNSLSTFGPRLASDGSVLHSALDNYPNHLPSGFSQNTEYAPKVGFSAGAYNLVNHQNPSSIDPVVTSSTFGHVTSVGPPRRIQLGMRLEF
jgi:hypothetical protein